MCLRAHLQRHVTALGGYTLQGLVVAEASAAFDHHAGRDVRVLRVLLVLLENVHQGLPGLAHALDVNFVEGENCKNKRSNGRLHVPLIFQLKLSPVSYWTGTSAISLTGKMQNV